MSGRNTALSDSSISVSEDIRQWFAQPLGQHVLQTESGILDQLLPGYFGYHLAQLSTQEQPLYESSTIRNKFSINLGRGGAGQDTENETGAQTEGVSLISHPAHLPFANDSLDVVLLHHFLEFTESPQETLREISRVTIPMGHVVIIGFNPISLWGSWKMVAGLKKRAPWNGHYIRAGRLMDWLNLLNFKIDRAQYAIYRPPASRFTGKISDFSQGVSRNLNLPIGSVYVIVARKHIGAIRPIRPVWKTARAFGRLSVVRSVEHDGLTSIEHPEEK